MFDDPVIQLGGVVVLAVAVTWLAARIRLPSILLLLTTGFLLGPVFNVLDPDSLLGVDLLAPTVSLAVGLILFEGGLSLRFREMAGQQRVLWVLVTVGVLITWLIGALATVVFTDLSRPLSVLIGSILVVSGPTVVGPLLRHVRPSRSVASLLKWESIFIDPVGALLAVLTFEILLLETTEANLGAILEEVLVFVVAGVLIGVILAYGLVLALRRHWVPEQLLSLVGISTALLAFIAADSIAAESGLLATTVLGLVLANHRTVRTEQIVRFSEVIRVLLIGVLFIVLSARLNPDKIGLDLAGAIGIILAFVLIARPLAVAVATWRSRLSVRERVLLGGVAPRGIVAASIASVFALELEAEGVVGADELTPIVFAVIVGTVTIYGLGMGPLARRLGLAERHQEGILIVGAGVVERALATSLHSAEVPVVMATTNRRDHYLARMEGMRAFYGNVLDRDVDLDIDLSGIGRMMAMTPNDDVNTLASNYFAEVFGGAEVYQLQPRDLPAGIDSSPATDLGGRFLFPAGWDYLQIQQVLDGGGSVSRTKLGEGFTIGDYEEQYGGRAIPLFLVRADGRVRIVRRDTTRPLADAGDGDTVVALLPAGPGPAEAEDQSDQATAKA